MSFARPTHGWKSGSPRSPADPSPSLTSLPSSPHLYNSHLSITFLPFTCPPPTSLVLSTLSLDHCNSLTPHTLPPQDELESSAWSACVHCFGTLLCCTFYLLVKQLKSHRGTTVQKCLLRVAIFLLSCVSGFSQAGSGNQSRSPAHHRLLLSLFNCIVVKQTTVRSAHLPCMGALLLHMQSQ